MDDAQAISVVVVGAGIVGASVAWHLAGSGHRVLVLERGAPASGVTAGAFGWLNSANGGDETARAARAEALALWHQPPFDEHVTWCGALRDVALAGAQRFAGEAGVSVSGPVWETPEDGTADPVAVALALLDAPGITLRSGVAVTKVAAQQVWAGDKVIPAQAVVVAAGLGSLTLLPELAIWPGPVALVDFGVCPPMLERIVQGWGVELRQRCDGTLIGVAGVDADAREVQAKAQALLARALPRPLLRRWDRPMSQDAAPVVGRQPSGVFAAVGHPGVIMAPLIGRRIADAVGAPQGL